MKNAQTNLWYHLLFIAIVITTTLFLPSASKETVQSPANSCNVYLWKNPHRALKAILMTIHGATLHGRVFDVLGQELANRGITVKTNQDAIRSAKKIPPFIPILVLQGVADRVYKPKAMYKYISKLKARDKQFYWVPEQGHLLLETAYVKRELFSVIDSWVTMHQALLVKSKEETRPL